MGPRKKHTQSKLLCFVITMSDNLSNYHFWLKKRNRWFLTSLSLERFDELSVILSTNYSGFYWACWLLANTFISYRTQTARFTKSKYVRWLIKALFSNRFLYFQEIFLDKGQKAFIVVLVFQTEHIVANYRRPRFEGIQSKIDSKGIEIGHLRLLSSALGPIFPLSWKFQNKKSHYQ